MLENSELFPVTTATKTTYGKQKEEKGKNETEIPEEKEMQGWIQFDKLAHIDYLNKNPSSLDN